jgi:hypothetical protein
MVVRKVAAHLCLTLIITELKISVEHDRVVTTLNIIFSVAYMVKLYYCNMGVEVNLWVGTPSVIDQICWRLIIVTLH